MNDTAIEYLRVNGGWNVSKYKTNWQKPVFLSIEQDFDLAQEHHMNQNEGMKT